MSMFSDFCFLRSGKGTERACVASRARDAGLERRGGSKGRRGSVGAGIGTYIDRRRRVIRPSIIAYLIVPITQCVRLNQIHKDVMDCKRRIDGLTQSDQDQWIINYPY